MNPIQFLVNHLMLPVLEVFHTVSGNYGWSIVMLTIVIKMLLLPLTMKSHYSMREMQRLQPKFKQIQERYKNKPEELNKHMMRLYKEHKVNPLGGCLPLLIQMPFLIALYASLMADKFKDMLMHSDPSFFFIPNLAKIGVFTDKGVNIENLVMVIIFGVTTYLQQKTMSSGQSANGPGAAMQKQMATMMPLMITGMFLMFPVPSGVLLYMVVSNIIGVAQYAYLNQKMQSEPKNVTVSGNGSRSDSDIDAIETKVDVESIPAIVSASYSSRKKTKYGKKKSHKKKKRK